LRQDLDVRADLLRDLHGRGTFVPHGRCKYCDYTLTIAEIVKGFLDDPNDYTTECPKCNRRFAPIMRTGDVGVSWIEQPFYCGVQTLSQLEQLGVRSPEVLMREHPAIYDSALFHFGTIAAAYKRNGKEYDFDPLPGWNEKIIPYLGKAPDTVLAECVGQGVRTIRRMRSDREIPPYRRGKKEA
jgi:hypothetical protein